MAAANPREGQALPKSIKEDVHGSKTRIGDTEPEVKVEENTILA